MLIILHQSTDPYFNVAADEFVLKNLEEDCVMLWRNDNAVIVGKYQNALAEINYDYVKKHNTAVIRRLSGGGAVYHDLGNLNFSFTQTGQDSNLANFRKFTQPIVDVLQSMGVNAGLEGKSDLMIESRKISGNAAHIYRNKILSHGTILFSSEMHDVSESLRINREKYIDKAVRSNPKKVTNVSAHLKTPMRVEEFAIKLRDYFLEIYPDSRLYEFTPEDIRSIQKLRDEKYATYEWNFGRSPNYSFQKTISTPDGMLEINFDVKKGIIDQMKISGDLIFKRDIRKLESALSNILHEENAIRRALSNIQSDTILGYVTDNQLIDAMF